MLEANTILGRIARMPLRLLPRDAVVPMLSGKARGAKWIAHSGLHGFWIGTFESDIRRVFENCVAPGAVVYDIGAHVGLYTVIAAKIGATVIAFEPLPRNLVFLHRHIEMNALNRVRVVEAAVTSHNGEVRFEEHGHAMGRIGDGELVVKAISIDTASLPPPSVVKMDIEGGEYNAMLGMKQTLEAAKPVIFLSTHGEEVASRCVTFLYGLGYRFQYLRHNEILAIHYRAP